ncbi:peptidyl-tRNA hydrolase protein 1 [Entomortierella chlamydospora]|uniref:peptidyl-tRNA hydrolase n=1 Tax=Entomortierella chlamydospora TaxID=101097 RepID=A0A9P6T2T6_9FUNG|nr:peptidyl-tRNA hydrolase protein 1 [Entomortierella chlamydospora]KAG0020966.1 peptidyl-tRNA hydrolase protein 1 [Entomortierella chlamydospora]
MMVVDSIAKRFNAPWTKMGKWQADIATVTTTFSVKKKFPPQQKPCLHDVTPATPQATTGSKGNASSDPTTTTPTPTPVVRVRPPVEYETIDLKFTLLKSWQPMNLSGSSVFRAARDLNLKHSEILVIHDDMERDIGKISFKSQGSANGHNGIKSCIKSLSTQHFKRLRIGIGRPESNERSSAFIAKYVLGSFKPLEIEKLEELVYDKAGDEIIRTTVHPSTPALRSG